MPDKGGDLPPLVSAVMIPVVCGDGQVRRFASHLLPLVAPHGELLAVAAIWVALVGGPRDGETGKVSSGNPPVGLVVDDSGT